MLIFLTLSLCIQPAPTADVNAPHGVFTYSIKNQDGDSIPAKLTFTDNDVARKELFVNAMADPKKLAVRSHAVYTLDGEGTITVPVGTWDITASHGIEWSLDKTTIIFEEGKEYSWDALLDHEIDTTDWISGDFHLHTLTHSGHGDSNMNERIISLIGENVEFAVATDHNHNTDYQPTIDALDANEHITAVVGNEVSTNYGHLNAFPFDANAKVVNQKLEAPALFKMIRDEKNDAGVVPIIQINHPRWRNIDYFGRRGLNPITGESENPNWSWDFDSIEVLNENPGWGFYDAELDDIETRSGEFSVLQDWYNMLNAGRKIAAVGNSDSHTVTKNIAGIPRNFVYTGTDDAGNIDPALVTKAIRDGRMSTTTGPFIRMTANGYPMGSTIQLDEPVVDIHISAQVASWIDLDTIQIIQNGDEVASITYEGQRDGPLTLRPRLRIDAPRDCWVVAIAQGDEHMAPFVIHSDRPVTPIAIANPIYIDANGDGKWTSPRQWARTFIQENAQDLDAVISTYNSVNPSEQALLMLESGYYPALANKMIRLGLTSDARIVKLAACTAAKQLRDEDLLEILAATIDNPASDRFLAFSAWAAVDSTDNERGKKLLKRYANRFGWINARRFTRVHPLRLPGDFIREWQVAGYFEIANDDNRLSNLANQKQIPEPNIIQLTVPKTKNGNPLTWVDMKTNKNGYLNLSLGKETENTICYARCWLWSPDTRQVEVTIGSDDACRIWVRDELVWDDPNWHEATADKNFETFMLQKGWNPVLVKILNGLEGMGFYFRVLDEDVKHASSDPEA